MITKGEGAVEVGLYAPLWFPILPCLQVFECFTVLIELWDTFQSSVVIVSPSLNPQRTPILLELH